MLVLLVGRSLCLGGWECAQLPIVTPAVVLVVLWYSVTCTPVGGRWGCLPADRRRSGGSAPKCRMAAEGVIQLANDATRAFDAVDT